MTFDEFQRLLSQHAPLFTGPREPPEAVDGAQRALGVALPEELRWQLTTQGYGPCFDALDETVRETLEMRKHGLPHRLVLISERGDGGSVFLDSSNGSVYWVDHVDVEALVYDEPLSPDARLFADYPSWCQHCISHALRHSP